MPSSIDELYARWQANPDPAQTALLCDALRGSSRSDLVEIVGSYASRQLDIPALLAAARMYTDGGRLDDAQSVLVAAGRLAPRDGDVYRWLGEVLLRRGDAERAEKVLERALHFGGTENARAGALLEKARALLPTQRSSGAISVAQEIARAFARDREASDQPVRQDLPRFGGEEDDEAATQVRDSGRSPVGLGGPMMRSRPSSAPRPAAAPLSASSLETPPAGSGHGPLPPIAPPSPKFVAPATSAPQGSLGSPLGPPQGPLPPLPPLAPLRAADFAGPPQESAYRGAGPARVPEPRDVLDALQIAGVYEPGGAVKPQVAWDKPISGKRRIGSTIALAALAIVLVGGGIGTYSFVRSRRAKEHLVAEELLGKVDAKLATSDVGMLDASEQEIGQTFDLESRSPHAALTWLHERAMKGLLAGGADLAFEESTARAKEVGVPDGKTAFARVASFLFQGDTAGAAAAVAKWDPVAQDDAWFHLLAGATFERAGDPRARERYGAAVKLDPSLLAAQILLARAAAIDGDPKGAMEQAKDLRTRYPDRVEPVALVALAWARDPMRGDAPPELAEVAEKADALPASLRSVAHAARAIRATDASPDEAKASLQKALSAAETPGVAAWIGSLALTSGDEALARKAALAAVSFSAVYPPARVLAARVALMGARLDEALKAVEDLPPSSPDVAVVTAAVAYEKLDAESMSRALDAAPADARKLPFVVPLVRGLALLTGSKKDVGTRAQVLDMADDDGPWADLVAIDDALDTGDLDLAAKIAGHWKGDVRAPRAVRLARLARYEGRLEEADRLSAAALESGTVTIRALAERVFTLAAMNKTADSLAVFKAHPNVGGPLAKWLRAYAAASGGKVEEAKAIVSQEDPPPELAPMPAKIIAASAYGAMKDARHGRDYVKEIVKAGFVSPDVAYAAERLGGGKVGKRR